MTTGDPLYTIHVEATDELRAAPDWREGEDAVRVRSPDESLIERY